MDSPHKDMKTNLTVYLSVPFCSSAKQTALTTTLPSLLSVNFVHFLSNYYVTLLLPLLFTAFTPVPVLNEHSGNWECFQTWV